MSPVVQQRCVAGGCVVWQGDRTAVQHLEGNPGKPFPLLQFFAHCYSLFLAIVGLEMRANYTMPGAAKGCVIVGLGTGVSRIGASIAVGKRPVNREPLPGIRCAALLNRGIIPATFWVGIA